MAFDWTALKIFTNRDFVGDFNERASELWKERCAEQGLHGGAEACFLVVGEELSLPMELRWQKRLDEPLNDKFLSLIRAALIGQTEDGLSFEDTVQKAIDCCTLGFEDGAQAVNYVTSDDVGISTGPPLQFLQELGH